MHKARLWKVGSAVLATLLCASTGVGQGPESQGRKRVQQRFEREGPQPGDLVPDLTAYDENGSEFRLRELREHYTVLVFGCLT